MGQQLSPGLESSPSTFENNILWPGFQGEVNGVLRSYVILSTTVDAGNTARPTLLRPGLIMAFDPAGTGKITAYHSTTAPDIAGVLQEPLSMFDRFGAAVEDKPFKIFVSGNVYNNALNLVNGDANANAVLQSQGFNMDSDVHLNSGRFLSYSTLTMTGGVTLTADSPYANFTAGVAGAITLPAIAGGLAFEFIDGIGAAVITSAETGNIIGGGAIDSDTATMGLGESLRVVAIQVPGGALAWLVQDINGVAAYA